MNKRKRQSFSGEAKYEELVRRLRGMISGLQEVGVLSNKDKPAIEDFYLDPKLMEVDPDKVGLKIYFGQYGWYTTRQLRLIAGVLMDMADLLDYARQHKNLSERHLSGPG